MFLKQKKVDKVRSFVVEVKVIINDERDLTLSSW